MQKSGAVFECHGFKRDAIVVGTERTDIRPQHHAHVVGLSIHKFPGKGEPKGVLKRLIVFFSYIHHQCSSRLVTRSPAVLGIEMQDQDVTPTLWSGERIAHCRKGVRNHGVDVALHVFGRLR